MMNSEPSDLAGPLQSVSTTYTRLQRQYQQLLDRATPHIFYRWLATVGVVSLFELRILLAQGVSLAIAIKYARLILMFAHVRDLFIDSGILCAVCILYFATRICINALAMLDAHAIYVLNLLLAFLQPKFDPSLQDDLMADEIEEGGGEDERSPLPSSRDDEFRPFVRRLPEWQFWLSTTRATIISFFLTFSSVFDVPVYWPILVMYFFVLFILTMRRQIQHMIKYRYIPFDWGRKARYGTSHK
ncbi:hypothetical protein EW146_g6935 [Bondarzewia mesenterica]|uniref:Protein RER1 n=1 Tax=Bondarzewia mesenterica TaxID=1095465 RepID=A0A4S4LMW7_9AGAM|nr:hypothetical protein EW146_g6935 [Bondarzewia mesenterica]